MLLVVLFLLFCLWVCVWFVSVVVFVCSLFGWVWVGLGGWLFGFVIDVCGLVLLVGLFALGWC